MLNRHVYCDPLQPYRTVELCSEYLAAKCFDRSTLAVNHFDGQPPTLENIYLQMNHGLVAAYNDRNDRWKIVKMLNRVLDAMIRLLGVSFDVDLMVLRIKQAKYSGMDVIRIDKVDSNETSKLPGPSLWEISVCF